METRYKYFDQITCINLLERDDRHQKASKIFNSLGIPAQFYRVKRDPDGGEKGCYTSHLGAIRKAYQAGCQNALIFEDDVCPTSSYDPKILDQVTQFLDSNQDWDLFFLGYCHNIHSGCFSNLETVAGYPNIVKLNGFCGHAYIINRKFMKYLLENHPRYQGTAYDIVFYGKGNQYATYPMLFRQNTQIDNDIKHTDLGSFSDLLFDWYGKIDQKVFLNGLLERFNYHRWNILIVLLLLIAYMIWRRY